MKKLIIINGTPGVGKSTVSKQLNHKLHNSVWLDGDWCWMMNPFVLNKENKAMVESNIYHIHNNFLSNTSFEHIIFSWVIGHDDLMDIIIDNLNTKATEIHKITLICRDNILRKRLESDGRFQDRIEDSIERQKKYHNMQTSKLNTTQLSINEVVEEIGEKIEDKY